MNWIQRIFGLKKKFVIHSVMQRSFLLDEMKKIKYSYKKRGTYCYELYTLIYAISLKENIPYGMDIHFELMNYS